MKFWIKSVKSAAGIFGILVLLWTGNVPAMTVDRVVAKVNNEIITFSGLMERYHAELARFQQAGILDQIPPEKQFMTELLEKMIDEKLLVQDGKKVGLSVEEKRIQEAVEDIKRINNLDDTQLQEMLKREATTLEQYKDTIRNQIMVSKVIGFQVKNRTKVSDKEVAGYYRKHAREFWQTGKVKARHILFIMEPTLTEEQRQIKEKTALEVLQRLQKGEPFEELAKQFSEDVSASNGGDLGFLEKGKMVKEFEEAVFKMKVGQVSDLIRTPYGIHIIKVDSIQPGKARPFDEVKQEIENILAQQKFKDVYDGYMGELRKSAFIEKNLFEIPKTAKGGLKPLPDSLNSMLNSEDSRSRQTASSNRSGRQMGRERSHVQTQSKQRPRTSSRPKIDPDSILPPLTIDVPGREKDNASGEVVRNPDEPEMKNVSAPLTFKEIQEELAQLKSLRDRKLITEAQYQAKKKELLKNLN